MVVVGHDSTRDLGDGPLLAWAQSIVQGPSYRSLGFRENGVSPTRLPLGLHSTTMSVPITNGYQYKKSCTARFGAEQAPSFVAPTFKEAFATGTIRRGNKLMQKPGFCYLRLFSRHYREYTARRLGKNPLDEDVLAHIATHVAHRRGDAFVVARITGLFQAHTY